MQNIFTKSAIFFLSNVVMCGTSASFICTGFLCSLNCLFRAAGCVVMPMINIHFRRCVLCPAIFTRFCVFVAGCAKASIGDRKKYVRCILKYVWHNLKYVRHIFCPLRTRMDKAFAKSPVVQQKSPLFLSAFSRRRSDERLSKTKFLQTRWLFCKAEQVDSLKIRKSTDFLMK